MILKTSPVLIPVSAVALPTGDAETRAAAEAAMAAVVNFILNDLR
jgi:hypothetical protein